MLKGDETAFRAFFDAYYRRLLAFAKRRSSLDEAAIDDVVQTTLIKSMRGLAGYRSDAALFTWLCAICWRELATAHKSMQKRAAPESLESLREAYLADLPAPDTCEPDRVYEAEALRSEIGKVFGELPAHYVSALKMKYLEGRGVRDVAKALAISEIGAQSVLSRARVAFRVACRSAPSPEA